jgi:UDP-N-acetylglucosamine acyltransferase
MNGIHPTAIVAPGARLGDDVEVGPYCMVGDDVVLGDRVVLRSHVVVGGRTTVGADSVVFPFACVGGPTQDLKHDGKTARVEIGSRTTLREYVTVNQPTFEDGLTSIGDRCHIMAYSHIAHDCRVGHGVILANAATLAGHVVIEDEAIVGGLTGIHQFVRIGRRSFLGGCSKAVQDVPPFFLADGNPLAVHGINAGGLSRHGHDAEARARIKEAYKILYLRSLNTTEAVAEIERSIEPAPEVQELVAFVREAKRGITPGPP